MELVDEVEEVVEAEDVVEEEVMQMHLMQDHVEEEVVEEEDVEQEDQVEEEVSVLRMVMLNQHHQSEEMDKWILMEIR